MYRSLNILFIFLLRSIFCMFYLPHSIYCSQFQLFLFLPLSLIHGVTHTVHPTLHDECKVMLQDRDMCSNIQITGLCIIKVSLSYNPHTLIHAAYIHKHTCTHACMCTHTCKESTLSVEVSSQWEGHAGWDKLILQNYNMLEGIVFSVWLHELQK